MLTLAVVKVVPTDEIDGLPRMYAVMDLWNVRIVSQLFATEKEAQEARKALVLLGGRCQNWAGMVGGGY
jgi:hypothetical protein